VRVSAYEATHGNVGAALRPAARSSSAAVVAVDSVMLVAAAILSQASALAGGGVGLPAATLTVFALFALVCLHGVRVFAGIPGASSALRALDVPLATSVAGSLVLLTSAVAHAGAGVDVARIWLFATVYVLGGRYVAGGLPVPTFVDDAAVAADAGAKRLLDLTVAVVLLLLFAPLFLAVAVAIKLDSPGPVFYRCRRIGLEGGELMMLKFRKMWDGASGLPLTASADDRLTRVGRVITDLKLDELPQLWNVVRGDMSLVGPRPEDPAFVRDHWDSFEPILRVKPGITGLCQLAFAKESQILDPDDRMRDYVQRLLPAKIRIDLLYASRRTVGFDVRIALWTVAAVVLRRDVAVNRKTGRLTIRRRPQEQAATSG
jgi:lipopolysaccharide/colanic/teichoic acid biosynthesis glycosyltransferase